MTDQPNVPVTINGGCLVDVDLPIYVGKAGFVDRGDGTASMSFKPNRTGNLPIGETISAGERNWTLVSNASSGSVRGFRVLELAEAK